MRVACLYVPDFPLAAWLRAQPEARGTAFALVTESGPKAKVVAASPEALERGVVCGWTAAQARIRCARLALHPVSADRQRAAQAALCDVAESFSPRVEDAGAGVAYFDAAGLGSLFADEQRLAQVAALRAEALGLPAQVGVAGSKAAAYLAARDGSGIAVLPPGEEWALLAPVAVELLAPSPALAETLRRWGVQTVGDLVALPAAALATRLGPEGQRLAALARGDDRQPLWPRTKPPLFEEGVDVDYGIDSIEPFLFVLRGLLDRLIARLEVRGLVCGDLRLGMRLADRARDERTVSVAAPSNDRKALLGLLRSHLEMHPAAAAVEVVRLTALAERLRPAQLDLFRPSGPAPARLATTLAQLTSLCGADRVGAPALAADHHPDGYGLESFQPQADAASLVCEPSPRTEAVALVLRAFRPAPEIEVLCHRGRPQFVRGAAACGRVVQAGGPWRRQGRWWDEGRYARDYYDAQLSDGGVYRIYLDLESERWFLDGTYD